MSNISVAEILKIHGKWVRSGEFTKTVAKKLDISERMAYFKIKEAIRKNEILRITLPDRTVIYGLAEFGSPKKDAGNFVQKELSQLNSLWKEINEISKLASNDLYVDVAFDRMLFLTQKLPEPLKQKLKPYLEHAMKTVDEAIRKYQEALENKQCDLSEESNMITSQKFWSIYYLIDKISTLLHDEALKNLKKN